MDVSPQRGKYESENRRFIKSIPVALFLMEAADNRVCLQLLIAC